MREGSPADASGESGALPKVSVLMITYNHEKFIAQAIDSVLMQETTFPVELVIGEDCSTDGTRAIVGAYQARHPDIIRLLPPEKNMGVKKNFVQTMRACRGEYIAMLEGDDYWTSAQKLQRQADYLDSHPECAACAHNVAVLAEGDPCPSRLYCPADTPSTIPLDTLIGCNPMVTCSVVFRGEVARPLPDWFHTISLGDWPIYILCAQRGMFVYMPEAMSVYRTHSGGFWSAASHLWRLQTEMDAIELFDAVTEFVHHRNARIGLAVRLEEMANVSAKEADIANARLYFHRARRQYPFRMLARSRSMARLALNLYLPGRLRARKQVRHES